MTSFVGGMLVDRYGGKVVFGVGIVVWLLVIVVMLFVVMSGGLVLLFVARAVMGLGEGVALSCMNNVIFWWVLRIECLCVVVIFMGGF